MLTVTLIYSVAVAVMMGQNVYSSTELQYVINEQQPVGSIIADLVTDAGLRQTLDDAVLNALVFDVFHGLHSELFGVSSPSGIVRVKQIIDRDVICYKRSTCVIPLDVAIIRPSTYFRVGPPVLGMLAMNK